MAMVWGSPVRVAGTGLAMTITGSIAVNPYTMDPRFLLPGFGFAFTQLGSISVSTLGGAVGLMQTYQDGVAEAGESRWRWYASVAGGGYATGPEVIYRYYPPMEGGPPDQQLGPNPLTAAFSISYSGLVIKRQHGINALPKRAHMHPRDSGAADGWYLTPDFQVIATIGGIVVTSPARRDWPEFAGLTDAQIGDEPAGDIVVNVSQFNDTWRSWAWGYELTWVTIAGIDFTGCHFHHAGGNSGSQRCGYAFEGNGGLLTSLARELPVSSVHGSSGFASAFLPILYSWDAGCRLFGDDDPALDPEVWAGYIERDSSTTPCTYRGKKHLLSALPNGSDSVAPVQGGPYDETDRCAIPYDPRQNIAIFSLAVDEEWALRNWLCPGGAVEYIEGEAIEDQSDRYFTLQVPGVNAGCGGGTQAIGGVEHQQRDCLPLAPGRSGDPQRRWSCEGDVAEAAGSTLAAPRFAIAPGGTGTASYQPVTRMWERLALIPQPGSGPNWSWPWFLKAAEANDDPDPTHPNYAEDVFHWGGLSFLRLRLTRPAGVPLELRLVLSYSTIEVIDPHYTCGSWRIEEWEYTRSSGQAAYSFTLPADEDVVHVDLLCPDDGSLPRLYVVDEVRVEGLSNPTGEAIEIELAELALVPDPGTDHTGRDAEPAPRLVGSVKETFDFFSDWQGMSLAADGNTRVLEWPGDPWRNSGPERGRGFIEPLQHCPTYSGPAGMLHYARPLTELGAAKMVEGFLGGANADAMIKAPGAGGAPESMAAGWMYWGANGLWIEPEEDEAGIILPGSIHVASWHIAKNYSAYVLSAQKRLGGAAWGLLKSADGRRRVIRDSVEAMETLWVIWWRVAAYRDADGEEIEAPAGCPAAGQWAELHWGAVNDRVDQHGLFVTPGLKPSKTRIWNAARGADPSAHSDTAEVEYMLQFWAGPGEPWRVFELNTPEGWEAMQAAAGLVDQAQFAIATRRLTPLQMTVSGTSPGGNLVRLRVRCQVITRGGRVWTRPGEEADWTAGRATTAPLPLLLAVDGTDDLALLDDGPYRSAMLGAEPWEAGLPAGLAPEVEGWLQGGRVTDGAVGHRDGLPVAVAVRSGGSGAVLAALTREAPVELGSLAADPRRLWPWLSRRTDGTWRIGLFDGGTYREWRSTRLDGTAWEPVGEQVIGPAADLTGCGHWQGRDGDELVAGWHGSGRVNVFWRGGPETAWMGPFLEAAAPRCQPYAYLLLTGGAQVGWLEAGAWRIWQAERPAGEWSER